MSPRTSEKPEVGQGHPAVEGALGVVRELLDMDVAYVSRIGEHGQRVEQVDGDAEAFGLQPGTTFDLEQSYCVRMLSGEVPHAIPDTAAEPGVANLPVTHELGIGAYVGVPVRLSHGRLFGSFCCLSRAPSPELRERDVRYLQSIARLIADHIEREELASHARVLELQASSFGALLAALDARDSYTGDHSEAVVGLASRVARRMGLDEAAIRDAEQVALIHDVGKLGTPDTILQKQGPLTDKEWVVMRQHPVIGGQIVRSVKSLAHLADAVRAEHERWDGGGYPDGLAGEAIPLASRIVLACDAWHAMRSDRPYRSAMSATDARREMLAGAGTQFAPAVVDALLAVVDELDPGNPSRKPEMNMSQGLKAATVLISASGDIDMRGAQPLSRDIDRALRRGARLTAVDLSGASYFDSAALTVLLTAHLESAAYGTRVVLVSPSPIVQSVIEAAGLRDVFAIVDSLEDAGDPDLQSSPTLMSGAGAS